VLQEKGKKKKTISLEIFEKQKHLELTRVNSGVRSNLTFALSGYLRAGIGIVVGGGARAEDGKHAQEAVRLLHSLNWSCPATCAPPRMCVPSRCASYSW
jgi:hypothetical protein